MQATQNITSNSPTYSSSLNPLDSLNSPINFAILISGRGTNMVAIAEYLKTIQPSTARIVQVISSSAQAPGIQLAKQLQLPVCSLERQKMSKEAFEKALLMTLQPLSVTVILLAGFMSILSANFIRHYPNRILNIHPSLLPKYPGLNTHQKVIDSYDTITGATIHLVNEEVDGGRILKQASIPVYPEDTADVLAKRLLNKEHQLYVEVIQQLVAQGTALLDS